MAKKTKVIVKTSWIFCQNCRPVKIDFAYYDPPYCNSHSDYQAFYHLLETFVEGWGEIDKKFINRTQRYHPPRHSGFDKAAEIKDSFRKLFALSDEIPHWLISYNDRFATKNRNAGKHGETS